MLKEHTHHRGHGQDLRQTVQRSLSANPNRPNAFSKRKRQIDIHVNFVLLFIIIIITFLFTQGMPKQLKTGFHWGSLHASTLKNKRGNSLTAPQFRGNQVYTLRRSAQENQFLMTVLSRNACIIAVTLSDERFTKFNFERT